MWNGSVYTALFFIELSKVKLKVLKSSSNSTVIWSVKAGLIKMKKQITLEVSSDSNFHWHVKREKIETLPQTQMFKILYLCNLMV